MFNHTNKVTLFVTTPNKLSTQNPARFDKSGWPVGGDILHHLHHRDRLLHDEHFRRFRHRHVPAGGRARVQELRARQEPGMKIGEDFFFEKRS